nr:immunoglobulin heavy chain junction region [Macaca mulatta]
CTREGPVDCTGSDCHAFDYW